MKKLQSLGKSLSKTEQKKIVGGYGDCSCSTTFANEYGDTGYVQFYYPAYGGSCTQQPSSQMGSAYYYINGTLVDTYSWSGGSGGPGSACTNNA